jgi:hypothetical protein
LGGVILAAGGADDAGRVLAVAISMALSGPSVAATWEYTREAESGKAKVVWRYQNWNSKCEERGGVVRVVTRPQHGTLLRKRVVTPVLSNRLNPSDHCIGKVVPGLEVSYKSASGFHGTDRFVIERTLASGRVDIDTFIVTVR